MRRIFRSIYLLLNLAAIGWLFLCLYASYYNAEGRPGIVSLFSFSCFFAALTNVVFVFSWLFSRTKWRALLSLATLALCWPVVKPVAAFNYLGKNNTTADASGLKIMTWNVHLFDLGGWTKDKTSKEKILTFIKEENPDLLCLQEYYWEKESEREPYTALIQQLGYPFVKFSREHKLRKNFITSDADKREVIYTGHAIFSKYPLYNEQQYTLEGDRYNLLKVDVEIDEQHTFSLNVVHLTSVGFGRKEMSYIEDVKSPVMDVKREEKSRFILRKLRDASARRAALANKIDSLKRRMDHPIIICGDFNDMPGSYVYQKVKGRLADAFVAKGSGLGRTYRKIFPTLRIDYILYDDKVLKAEGYKRPPLGLSDHFPVIANFSYIKEAGMSSSEK